MVYFKMRNFLVQSGLQNVEKCLLAEFILSKVPATVPFASEVRKARQVLGHRQGQGFGSAIKRKKIARRRRKFQKFIY